MLRPSPPPPHPYMRIACMHMTECVSFTSCLINNTVLCHSTLLCANFTPLYATLRPFAPLCATLRLFTPLCATLLYLGRPVSNGMKLPDKPPELNLHQLEERLIALRIPSMQIKELPCGGQYSLRGNVINVPTTYNLLYRHPVSAC